MKRKSISIRYLQSLLFALTYLIAPRFAQAAQLIYSNDVLGDIEPCGCRSNPLGGMARRENWLSSLTDSSRLIVDSGNLLFESKAIPELLRKNAFEKAKVLIDAMNATHLDLAVAGAKDFALGYDTFKELRRRARFRYLGANVVEKATGQAPFDSYAVVTLKSKTGTDLRVAVVGLVAEGVDYPPELKITSVVDAIQKTVAEVESKEKKIDLWVALTHGGYDADVVLAKMAQPFRFIIGSGTESFLQNPERVEKSILFQTSFRNQYMGKIELDGLSFQSDGFHRLVGLDASFNSKQGKPNFADRLIAAYKKTNRAADPSKPSKASLSAGSESKFATFPKCASCHYEAFRFWISTPHARAIDALEKPENLNNPECIVCHSVGFGAQGGFSDLNVAAIVSEKKMTITDLKNRFHSDFLKVPMTKNATDDARLKSTLRRYTRSWAPVQCENCHGAGFGHSENSALKLARVGELTCVQCHTPERAPEWYDGDRKLKTELFRSKLARIRCPATHSH